MKKILVLIVISFFVTTPSSTDLAVHPVGGRERARLATRVQDIALDRGESSLWAHALSRRDAWVLCGTGQGQPSLRRQAGVSRAARVLGTASQRHREPAEDNSATSLHRTMAQPDHEPTCPGEEKWDMNTPAAVISRIERSRFKDPRSQKQGHEVSARTPLASLN